MSEYNHKFNNCMFNAYVYCTTYFSRICENCHAKFAHKLSLKKKLHFYSFPGWCAKLVYK